MKIGYVINPVAGKKQVKEWIARIQDLTEQYGFAYKILTTERFQDGINKGRAAVQNNCDIVVAVGGDGTVSEIVNGIKDSDAILGVIPVGTGNDFVKSLGIPLTFEEALKCIFNGKNKEIDLGIVDDKYFINVASVGFDAQVVIETQKIKKNLVGPAAYVMGIFKALMGYTPFHLEIETEDSIINRQAVLIAVGNGIFYGGGMKITPHAKMDDGLLDVCLVNSMSKGKIVRLFPLLFSGKHLSRPEVEYFKVKRIKVECNNGHINSDGDIIGKCPASFRIEPHAIKVLIP